MVHVARRRSADVAFVTNDAKADWWEIDPLVSPRRLLRGRRELSHEFRAETSRAFAVFHGLRLVRDLTALDMLFKQIPAVFAEWQKKAEMRTRLDLRRLQHSMNSQWDWSNKFSHVYGLAGMNADLKRYERLLQQTRGLHGITGINAEVKRHELMMQQATRGILGIRPGITGFPDGTLPPSVAHVVNPLNFGTRQFAVRGIARALGLHKLSLILSGTNPIRDIMNAFQMPDTARILRDITFNVSALAAPYTDHVQALIADARIPGFFQR
jgi:hypothetical protein